MSEDITKVQFTCNGCGGELILENGNIVFIEELDPLSIGTRKRKVQTVRATCKKCKEVIEDYFK